MDLRNFKAALSALNESLRVQAKAFSGERKRGKNYPNFSWTYHILGNALLKQGDIRGAISKLELALKMRKSIAKSNPRFLGALASTLTLLGDAYSTDSKRAQAKRCYMAAYKIISGKDYGRQLLRPRLAAERRRILSKLDSG